MEEKLKEIERKLDLLTDKVSSVQRWIDNLNEDFLWDFTDFDQPEMFSWFHLADSVERMEAILLALNQKFNINSDGIDIDLSKKLIDSEIAIAKLSDENKELKARIDNLKETYEKEKHKIDYEKLLPEATNKEWEKIAQTISHTMKGPNNNIVNKISDLINQIPAPTQKINSLLKIIEAEAKYSNDIIKLFDIIRTNSEFKTEPVSLQNLIDTIKKAELRCISLAWNNAPDLKKGTLERLKGEIISNEAKDTNLTLLKYKNIEKLNLEKSYTVHKTAINAVIDEFVLNMFRYAQSSKEISPKEYAPYKEKPEIFETELLQENDKLSIVFRNTSREPIHKAFGKVIGKDKVNPLTKTSFGLYLASLFSFKYSPFPSITFYDFTVPEHNSLSEVILTLKEQ